MDSWGITRKLALAGLGAYALALLVLVGGPWGWALNRLTVHLYVLFRYDWPIAPDWALPEHYGVLLNVVLFVPLGVLVAVLTRWPGWLVVLAAGLVSAAIEVAQIALEREATWVDVAANVLGAGGGVVLLALWRWVRRDARHRG